MKSYWRKRLTAIALVCLMVLMMVPETALSVYAADEDEILVGAEEIVEQDAEVPEEAVELPEISEVYPETLEGSEEEFVEEDAEEVIIEDAPVILEEEAEPEIQSEVPEIYDEEIEVADPASVDAKAAEAEELVGAAASAKIVVKKEWADDAQNHGSDTVTAVVKWGNTTVGTVTLESSNGWRAEVTGLDANRTYTVEETAINGEPITGKYEATVTKGTSSNTYVWVKKNVGQLTKEETYVFTYTYNGTTYALGSHWVGIVCAFDGTTENLPTDWQPNNNIDSNHRWTVGTGNDGNYSIVNDQHEFDVTYTAEGYLQIHRLLTNYWLHAGSNGNINENSRTTGRAVFTPYEYTKVTTTEYTITNTKINDYKLVYDANGGTGAPAAQTASTTATSQAFTVSTAAPSRGEAYSFEGWATTPNATTANVGSSVTVTTSDPQVDGVYSKTIYAVWKARDEFYVYHTGVDGGNIETRYIGGSSNDLTLNLTENTLYGGYYLESGLTKPADGAAYDGSNWTFTNAEKTDPGTAISPVPGTTYYVKEVPITYLKPTTYVLYDTTDKDEGASNCKGRLQRLFAMAAVDDEQYSSIGFDISGVSGVTGYNMESAFTQFVVTKGGQPYKTYTASNVFKDVTQGNLAVANMTTDLLHETYSYTMTPYWITKDGIKVTSVYQYAQSIGNGYHYGWVSPGITKAMTKPGSTLTPQTRTLNTRKLSLSRYVFNDDEPDPTETVNPPETVEPTTVPTETVEPEPTTEPTTEPTETVEHEPTTAPTEETVVPTAAPEEETVKPTETPAPTTAPTTPSSSSMNNTTPSGVIAKLLRMLGSLFK